MEIIGKILLAIYMLVVLYGSISAMSINIQLRKILNFLVEMNKKED